jgi:hypothetical protein
MLTAGVAPQIGAEQIKTGEQSMTYQSFEEALKICLTAEDGSPAQNEALLYCVANAPDDLKEMLQARFGELAAAKHDQGGEEKHDKNCGCKGGGKKPNLTDHIK